MGLFSNQNLICHKTFDHSPPGCIMQPAMTFVNVLYAIKITQYLRMLPIPLTVNFIHVVCKAAHNNVCSPLSKKKGLDTPTLDLLWKYKPSQFPVI